MKYLALIAVALLTLAMTHAASAASTELESFEQKAGKYAVDSPSVATERPKGLCVCQDGSDHHGQVGSLQKFRETDVRLFVAIRCWVQGFGADDGRNVSRFECPTWVPLSK